MPTDIILSFGGFSLGWHLNTLSTTHILPFAALIAGACSGSVCVVSAVRVNDVVGP